MNEKNKNTGKQNENNKKLKRRDIIKGLASVPVLGLYGYALSAKVKEDLRKKEAIIKELNLEDSFSTKEITEKKTAGDTIRLGIIGIGARGPQLARALNYPHPDWVKNNTSDGKYNANIHTYFNQYDLNVRITGVCDVFDIRADEGITISKSHFTKEGFEEGIPGAKRFMHYQDMLESDEIDAVIITTPDHWHAQMAIDAAKAGKHVYLEKCMTRTVEEAIELYDEVKKSNIKFQLGHQNRQQVSHFKAREIIKKGIIGDVNTIEVATNRNTDWGAWIRTIHPKGNEKNIDWNQFLGNRPKIPFNKDRFFNWQKWFDYGTGVVGQLFSHEYDAINQIMDLGIPSSAVASGGIYHYKDDRDIPDVFNAVYEYPEKKLTLTYSATLANSKVRGRVFLGHDGTLEVGRGILVQADRNSERYKEKIGNGTIDPSNPLFAFNPESEAIDAVTSATAKYYHDRGFGHTYRDGKLIDAAHLHLKDWLDCIRFGGTPRCHIERGLEEAITCHMATLSYLEKRRIEWDPVNRKII